MLDASWLDETQSTNESGTSENEVMGESAKVSEAETMADEDTGTQKVAALYSEHGKP